MARGVHFELLCDDPNRAGAFYERVLGWSIEKPAGMERYWLAETGPAGEPGINGGIMDRDLRMA